MDKVSVVDQLQEEAWNALECGEYKKALRVAKQIIKKRHSSGFEVGAVALAGLDKNAEAIELLKEGVSKAPDVDRLWQLLGSMLSEDGQLEEALEAYDRAEQCPSSYLESIAYNRAIVLDKLKRYEEALSVLDHSMATAGSLKAHFVSLRLGLLNSLQRYEKVVAAAKELDSLAQEMEDLEQEDEEQGDDEDGAEKEFSIGEDGLDIGADINNQIAKAWTSIVAAKKALGCERGELLETALHGLQYDIYCKEAQWWLREARNAYSPDARGWQVMMEGKIELREEGEAEARSYGYYRSYDVIADSQEEAFAFVKEFEAPEAVLEECRSRKQKLETAEFPKGVYFVSTMNLWDPEEGGKEKE